MTISRAQLPKTTAKKQNKKNIEKVKHKFKMLKNKKRRTP